MLSNFCYKMVSKMVTMAKNEHFETPNPNPYPKKLYPSFEIEIVSLTSSNNEVQNGSN